MSELCCLGYIIICKYLSPCDDRPVVLTCVSFLRPHVLVVLALTLTCKKINGTANMNAIRAASDQGN